MFEQFLAIKEKHPNDLLFYRMGDFYELFFEDAEIAARELQITLTSRSGNTDNKIPMCGVPHHSANLYLAELLNKGYRVAICEQVEDPKTAKGLVKREVVNVLTPGTILENLNIEPKGNNFLGALFWDVENSDKTNPKGAFAWLDCSTGYWTGLSSKNISELWQWVIKMQPRELVIPDFQLSAFKIPEPIKNSKIQLVRVPLRSYFNFKSAEKKLLEVQGVAELAALGLEEKPELARACVALLTYLQQTRKNTQIPLQAFKPLDQNKYLVIDEVTERNLELFKRMDGSKGSGTLLHVLDNCLTPMGSRLLQERLHYPFKDLEQITEIQNAVKYLLENQGLRLRLQKILSQVQDLERLSTRIHVNRTNPRDVLALGTSLACLTNLRRLLENPLNTSIISDNSETTPKNEPLAYPTATDVGGMNLPKALQTLLKKWDDLSDITSLIKQALVNEPPIQITEGGIFQTGFNKELDELIDLTEHGTQKLNELLLKEQEETGITKLKLGQNRIFGYFFEVPRALVGQLPERFTRRQTVANAERLTTPELKALEEKLNLATDRRNSLEYQMFQDLRERVASVWTRIIFMASVVSALDYWQSLAEVGHKNKWVLPSLHSGFELEIVAGRHPVVEAIQGRSNFIPNDIYLNENKRLIIITGPNMAGKSTVLRQTALITILAQMGSYVPANNAKIGIADRIFSRVGASDNLAEGQSTFMTEMMESARILRQAGRNSLVILDEVGRGTSTFDGLSLAWAIAEDLVQRANGQVRTLFATHYHELTALEGKISGIANMNIAIKESGGEIIFLRRLIPGPSDRSYGIEVAKLAGVPAQVIQRAKAILAELEKNNAFNTKITLRNETQLLLGLNSKTKILPDEQLVKTQETVLIDKKQEQALNLFQELKELDCDNLSPINALTLLIDWKKRWK
ncbi:DNA mismatch repair protein MutS [Desulfovibrio litoralis]|nr:DNA mismatch repair protein MutS [Desulfovibrio litoralis]